MEPTSRSRLLLALKIALIAAAGLWIYAPDFHGGWLMDDDLYLPNNPLRHDPARLWKIWSAPGQFIEYYPIEETLQTVQWWLWGNNTLGYHLTNVLLHIGSGLLVWRLLARFGLALAWLGGLLFVVHPANVESVAWIAEFKNTLSLPLFLLALTAWVDFESKKGNRDYWTALAFFLAAMLSKIAMAPFPMVILLYAWWKRGRVAWRDVVLAAPFFVISVVLGLMTILAGQWFLVLHHSPEVKIAMGGFLWRLDLIGITAAYYSSSVFWPFPLDPMIPPWRIDPGDPRQWAPLLVLLGGAAWFWNRRATWGRHALLGSGFFFLMVGPFLGFTSVSYMRNSWVFDHFLYLPMVGLIGLTVAATEDLAEKLTSLPRTIGGIIFAGLVGGFAATAHVYSAKFALPLTFFSYAMEKHPSAFSSHNAVGNQLARTGRLDEAIEEFREAEELDPLAPEPPNNLGTALFYLHRYPEAIEAYRRSITLAPNDAPTHSGLGGAYLNGGDLPDAIKEYSTALKLMPDLAQAHNGLANALLDSGRLMEAQAHAEEALKIAPDYVEATATLGLIYAREGRVDDAIAQFERARLLAPDDPRVTKELDALRAQKTSK